MFSHSSGSEKRKKYTIFGHFQVISESKTLKVNSLICCLICFYSFSFSLFTFGKQWEMKIDFPPIGKRNGKTYLVSHVLGREMEKYYQFPDEKFGNN